MSMSRSAKSSPSPGRIGECLRYHQAASRVISGGNRNPANAEGACTGGLERRLRFISPPSPIPGDTSTQQCPGCTPHTLVNSTYYEPMPDATDPRVAWIMDGLGEMSERMGEFGLVNGGAACNEIDRYDQTVETPHHTRLLASSVGHDRNAMLVPEELFFAHPAGNGEESLFVGADITYFMTPGGGGIFATASMAWCASLSHNGGDNTVSHMTGNVFRRFADPAPLEEIL